MWDKRIVEKTLSVDKGVAVEKGDVLFESALFSLSVKKKCQSRISRCMDKQSEGKRPFWYEYIAMYGQTVRGNSPFWHEYGQSGRRSVVIGKYVPVEVAIPKRLAARSRRAFVPVRVHDLVQSYQTINTDLPHRPFRATICVRRPYK